MVASRWSGLSGEVFARLGYVGCAATLLVAATLKLYQLFTDPALGVLYGSRWLQAGLVEYELLLALWLLSGIAFPWSRRVALVTFLGFGCVSFYLGVSGEASCRCFGRVAVSPWWTFSLDLALTLLLAASKSTPGTSAVEGGAALLRHTRLRAPVAIAAACTLVSVLMVAVALRRPGSALANADAFAGSRFVLLEPEKWIDEPFPLTEYIDIGDRQRLLHGSWVLVFYHHGCPKCGEVLPEYERLAEQLKFSSERTKVALIEVPPFGPAPWDADPLCARGRLSGAKQWFIKTPCEVRVTAGLVNGVSSDEDSLPTGLRRTAVQWPTNP